MFLGSWKFNTDQSYVYVTRSFYIGIIRRSFNIKWNEVIDELNSEYFCTS